MEEEECESRAFIILRDESMLNQTGELTALDASAASEPNVLEPLISSQTSENNNEIGGSEAQCFSSCTEYSGSTRSSIDGEHSLTCQLCGRTFKKAVNYRLHIRRMHSGAHKCKNCEANFDTQHELRKHVSEMHPKLHKCTMCEYTNRLLYQVKRHESQAHGERSVACSYCSTLLPYKQLQRHIRESHATKHSLSIKDVDSTAEDEKEKGARVRLQAQKIFENSIGENPRNFRPLSTVSKANITFQCSTCGQQRDSRVALRRHIARVHEQRYKPRRTTDKRFVCSEKGCEKCFTSSTLLEDHMNVHEGKRPFECTRCARSYACRSSYSRHLRNYHATSIRDVAGTSL